MRDSKLLSFTVLLGELSSSFFKWLSQLGISSWPEGVDGVNQHAVGMCGMGLRKAKDDIEKSKEMVMPAWLA